MKIDTGNRFNFDEKCARNHRVQNRYDELMTEGEQGHYETMFRIVHEEIELALRNAERAA